MGSGKMALSMHRLARFSGMGKHVRGEGTDGTSAAEGTEERKRDPRARKEGRKDPAQTKGPADAKRGNVPDRSTCPGRVEERKDVQKKGRAEENQRKDRATHEKGNGKDIQTHRAASEGASADPPPSEPDGDERENRTKPCNELHPFTSFRMVQHADRRIQPEENAETQPSSKPREDPPLHQASVESEEEEEDLFGTLDVWRWRFYRKWRNETGRNVVPTTQGEEEEEEGDDLEGIEFLRACTQDAANNFVSMSLDSQSGRDGSEAARDGSEASGEAVQTNGFRPDAAMLRRASLGQLLLEDPVVGALSSQGESPPETEPQWLKMDASRQKFATKLRTAKQLIEHQAELETRAAKKWATAKGGNTSALDTLLPVAISRSTSNAFVLMQAFDATGKRAYIVRSKPCENGLLNASLPNIFGGVVAEARAEIKKKGGQAHIIGGGVVTWKMDTGRVLVVKIPVKTWKLDFIEGGETRPGTQVWELCEFARFSVILLKQNLPYDVTVRWEEEQSRQQLYF